MRIRTVVIPAMALVLAAAAASCAAADAAPAYPTKVIRMVVGYAPGGAVDLGARVIAQKLAEALGQSIIVDNRAGADGIVGTEIVAKAPPDGYTLMYTSAGHIMNWVLHAKSITYHPIRSFEPVALVATGPQTLVIAASHPVKTLPDLVALAKAKPGQLHFASSGSGGPMHMSGELFKLMAGIDIVHVPYKGGGPALNDVISGQVEFCFIGAPASMPFIRSGRLRILAVTTAKRAAALPEVPTMAESGYPGFDVGGWYSLLAPKGTPAAIVGRLNAELAKQVALPDVQARLAVMGLEPVGSTPRQLTEYLQTEIDRWVPVVKAAGIKPD
jgi:tripartite-type tricarboxylate transporter receptor subunit TctC